MAKTGGCADADLMEIDSPERHTPSKAPGMEASMKVGIMVNPNNLTMLVDKSSMVAVNPDASNSVIYLRGSLVTTDKASHLSLPGAYVVRSDAECHDILLPWVIETTDAQSAVLMTMKWTPGSATSRAVHFGVIKMPLRGGTGRNDYAKDKDLRYISMRQIKCFVGPVKNSTGAPLQNHAEMVMRNLSVFKKPFDLTSFAGIRNFCDGAGPTREQRLERIFNEHELTSRQTVKSANRGDNKSERLAAQMAQQRSEHLRETFEAALKTTPHDPLVERIIKIPAIGDASEKAIEISEDLIERFREIGEATHA